jgi:beta-galactosidase
MQYSLFLIKIYILVVWPEAKAQERTVHLLDTNWRFVNYDVNVATLNTLNDATWQTVNVPHDWAVLGNFDMIL